MPAQSGHLRRKRKPTWNKHFLIFSWSLTPTCDRWGRKVLWNWGDHELQQNLKMSEVVIFLFKCCRLQGKLVSIASEHSILRGDLICKFALPYCLQSVVNQLVLTDLLFALFRWRSMLLLRWCVFSQHCYHHPPGSQSWVTQWSFLASLQAWDSQIILSY